jgi:hypothetical protein
VRKYTAFLSYAHTDNRKGSIGRLRKRLEDEATQSIGFDFEIFRDVEDIEPGERFYDRIYETVAAADFFIAVMTPSFFRSDMCKMEIGRFLECERLSPGTKFLLPIYWRDAQELESLQRTRTEEVDELVRELALRHWYDWREIRDAQDGDKMMQEQLRLFGKKIRKEVWAQASRSRTRSRKDGSSAYPTPTRTLVKISLGGGRNCFVVFLAEGGSLEEWDPWAPNERWSGRWSLHGRELSIQIGPFDLTASAQADGVYRGVEHGPYGRGVDSIDFIVVPTRHMNDPAGDAEYPGTWVKVTDSRTTSLVEMNADGTLLEKEVGGDRQRFGKWALTHAIDHTFLAIGTEVGEGASRIMAASDHFSVWTGIDTRNGAPHGRVLLAPVAELQLP